MIESQLSLKSSLLSRRKKKRSFDDYFNRNIDSDISSVKRKSIDEMKPLANDFVPGPKDVIFGRSKTIQTHEGNLRFQDTIEFSLEKYSNAASKHEKTLIVSSIVNKIRQDSPHVGFVKQRGGKWYEVDEILAREKVGQCFRDLLHSQYRSSSKTKQLRRIEEQNKLSDRVDELLGEANCKEITERIRLSAVQSCNEDDMQKMFNQANCELLQIFKNNDDRAAKKRKVSFDTAQLSSSKPDTRNTSLDLEPIPLHCTVDDVDFTSFPIISSPDNYSS